eukprot:TRINITY_DN17229_c0_g1_i1.p6 TRINITY_DN17229_c0_g1~~TRINITY_DN17229_c0_g1_i1.p6  ORF type:complete len:110 (+),score=0.26 TRINITY_DN17229_c0_g1_i1:88-417(+)
MPPSIGFECSIIMLVMKSLVLSPEGVWIIVDEGRRKMAMTAVAVMGRRSLCLCRRRRSRRATQRTPRSEPGGRGAGTPVGAGLDLLEEALEKTAATSGAWLTVMCGRSL